MNKSENKKGKLLVVSGPSGVGKGTIVKTLVSKRTDVVESVSCTTRAPRAGEIHGREYYFLTKEDFLRRVKENDFLEYDEHFGNFYGTPKSFVRETLKEKSVILEIDVVGGLNAKKGIPRMCARDDRTAVGRRVETPFDFSQFGNGRRD